MSPAPPTRSSFSSSSCCVVLTRAWNICWALWRHCCCRYGMLPFVVAPVATAACLLSLYSSAGCTFIHLQIGFVPVTSPFWNTSSTAELGLFLYDDRDHQHQQQHLPTRHYYRYYQSLVNHQGSSCEAYPSIVDQTVIGPDRTWKVSRIMAMMAGAASAMAAFLSWVIVFTPAPAACLWPSLVLPLVVTAFIAEGSKFLIFGSALCRDGIFPRPTANGSGSSANERAPVRAESCTLGHSAKVAIGAACVQLLALLLVCLGGTPQKRQLDPHFGDDGPSGEYYTRTPDPPEIAAAHDDDDDDDQHWHHSTNNNEIHHPSRRPVELEDGGEEACAPFVIVRRTSTGSNGLSSTPSRSFGINGANDSMMAEDVYTDLIAASSPDAPGYRNRRGPAMLEQENRDEEEGGGNHDDDDESYNDRNHDVFEDGVVSTPSPGSRNPAGTNCDRVSESRLSAMSKVERNAADMVLQAQSEHHMEELMSSLDTAFSREDAHREDLEASSASHSNRQGTNYETPAKTKVTEH